MVYSLDGSGMFVCPQPVYNDTSVPFGAINPENRFCQPSAVRIRREYFYVSAKLMSIFIHAPLFLLPFLLFVEYPIMLLFFLLIIILQ